MIKDTIKDTIKLAKLIGYRNSLMIVIFFLFLLAIAGGYFLIHEVYEYKAETLKQQILFLESANKKTEKFYTTEEKERTRRVSELNDEIRVLQFIKEKIHKRNELLDMMDSYLSNYNSYTYHVKNIDDYFDRKQLGDDWGPNNTISLRYADNISCDLFQEDKVLKRIQRKQLQERIGELNDLGNGVELRLRLNEKYQERIRDGRAAHYYFEMYLFYADLIGRVVESDVCPDGIKEEYRIYIKFDPKIQRVKFKTQ